jgi:hypothetical protein
MHSARPLLPLLVPLLALVPVSLLASTAEAAPPQRGGGFDEGGYIQGSPGPIAVRIADDDFGDPDDIDPAWPWSFGGGWMFARGPLFKATLGGAFEHQLLFFRDVDFDDFGVHSLHFLVESRIGAGTNKVWGYGLMGLGPGVTVVNIRNPTFGRTDAAPGFNMQLGGGIQGIVYRNLFLGGEIDFDLGFYFDDDYLDDDFSYHMMSIEFLIGWYF